MGGFKFAAAAAGENSRLVAAWGRIDDMESLYLLIPVSVILVFVIAGLFWWSVRSGQFDDLEGPAHRIIMDRDATKASGLKEKAVYKDRLPD